VHYWREHMGTVKHLILHSPPSRLLSSFLPSWLD
jgi:hypothetical protein